jgi:hypothetical protein
VTVHGQGQFLCGLPGVASLGIDVLRITEVRWHDAIVKSNREDIDTFRVDAVCRRYAQFFLAPRRVGRGWRDYGDDEGILDDCLTDLLDERIAYEQLNFVNPRLEAQPLQFLI